MAICETSIITSKTSTVLSNIESFMVDSSYREMIENSASYNTRLCIERRLRMPFLDAQTGVAQNHSNLFMSPRQRMPGLANGQVYTYPAKRWRKKRRQYLMNFCQTKRKESDVDQTDVSHVTSAVENPSITVNEDSKDSIGGSSSKDESSSKDPWYYEELEMQEMEGYDEPDPDSDYDYEDSYTKKRKKRGGKPSRGGLSDSPMKRGLKGFGRGRRKGPNYTPDYSDMEKPYYCDLCGARYKTRPGLTYHYTHSHKEKSSPLQEDDTSLEGSSPSSPSLPTTKDKPTTAAQSAATLPPPEMSHSPSATAANGNNVNVPSKNNNINATTTTANNNGTVSTTSTQSDLSANVAPSWDKLYQESYLSSYLNTSGPASGSQNSGNVNTKKMISRSPGLSMPSTAVSTPASTTSSTTPLNASNSATLSIDDGSSSATSESDRKDDLSKESSPSSSVVKGEDKDKANPSPYCDFCLGNEESNKKSGQPEELVSCSDCGRSGHPTCLQFTANMIISVRKYRWQCIECKCCSICGTSDNDDQLLFCDDCDRGYHMYCLDPPLSSPPEGSWSCKLCIKEFHS